jgi:GNAT superfamily N-acetyltransferase
LAELEPRRLTAADIPAADHLREQAGWNQTINDWQRLLCWEPAGCFVAEQPDGRVVATVTTTVYGGRPRLGWVGMMLVDLQLRRRGLGRALLSHALTWLERNAVRSMALDATPLGKTLYDGMQFTDLFTLQRREARAPGPGISTPGTGLQPLSAADVERVAELDAAVFFGADRRRVLRDLVGAHPSGCWLSERADGVLAGYVCSRPGARAWYVGPLVARDVATAERLLRAALAPLAGRAVLLDTPDVNAHAGDLAARYGFEPQRPFIRMVRGSPLPPARTDWCYGIAGPEIG